MLLGNGLAADLMPERLALHAGDRAHTWHLLQKGHVLGVIDLVEERFLGWFDIHADDVNHRAAGDDAIAEKVRTSEG